MSRKKKTEKFEKGWSRRDDGTLCYGADCYELEVPASGAPIMRFDEKCETELASEADRRLMQAVFTGEGVVYEKRRSK